MSSGLSLPDGYDLSGMTTREAYLRYIAVGGVTDEMQTEAHLLGLLDPGGHEHNVLAQAVNEHFIDLGQDHPVGYSGAVPNTHPDRRG